MSKHSSTRVSSPPYLNISHNERDFYRANSKRAYYVKENNSMNKLSELNENFNEDVYLKALEEAQIE